MKALTYGFALFAFCLVTTPSVLSAQVQTAELRAGDEEEFDEFGKNVDVDAGSIVAGAATDDEHGNNTGAAYVFQLVAHPAVELAGVCPGEMNAEFVGGTPGGCSDAISRSASPSG